MHFAKDFLNTLIQLLLLLRLCKSLETTIISSKSVKDGDFLVSENQTFVLGFFSPGTSSNRYVGIWYKFSKEMVVWVANRDNPVNDTSGILTISTDGNLVLLHNSTQGLPLWSTNVSVTPASRNSNMVQLLDSGNLVLVNELVNNKSGVLWQSFDHPTHVLLANMKIGLDHGKNIFLTSWNSKNDPGTGICSLRTEPNGSPQIFLYKNRTKLWRAGPWNGLHWSGLPNMNRQSNTNEFDIVFVNNKDEVTTKWVVLDPSVFSVIVIDGSGSLQQLAWQGQKGWVTIVSTPTDVCDKYGTCGPFGVCNAYTVNWEKCVCFPGYEPSSPENWKLREWSSGCKRQQGAPSMCRNGEGFVKIQNVKVPDISTIKLDINWTLEACEQKCLNNCSCLAYASADVRNGGSGCITWYGDLMDTTQFAQGQGQDVYIRADAIVSAKYTKKSKRFLAKKGMWLILVFPPISMVFLILYGVWCLRRKTKGSLTKQDGSRTHKDLEYFDLKSILVATDNFSTANKLGEGGFGPVYKGLLANGEEIAVKRLSKNSGQGLEQFKTELKLIAKLQHRNLVRLLGCCINTEEKMLIYEYLPNKSLDFFIFDRSRSLSIDWKDRFEIINGIARGVLYLHQDSRLKIVHRDIKASNVLLDSTMNPKISDFGLAKMLGEDQLQANTNRVIGTGYMSPEYAMEGRYSTKSDVFSFGVLLLEIISGKRNTDHNLDSPSRNLIGKIWDMWREGQALGIVDPSLSLYPAHEVSRCIHIGLLCMQESTTDRPTMSEVVYMLGKETPLTSPKKPAFILQSSNPNSEEAPGRGLSLNNFAQGQGQDLYIRADAIVSGSLMKQYGSIAHKDLEYFNLKSILAATDNFSIANKLGEGGFGPVYKGLLANGEEIAVKRLSKNSGQGLEQFKTEVKLIAKLQHRNLVRLLGCCFNSEEKMLIYEYLPNKSLDFFIFDRSRSLSIDWKKRFDIINGIARGVLYLHQDSRLKIVHRDIKASNVLLDSTMNPKISDFGLAKMIGEDQLQANTNRVIGTGYMSPEYAMEGRYSTKSDVFSFGILLLEIISGKRNTDYNLNSPSLNLIGEIWDMWRKGQALGIVDPSLSLYPAHEVSRCIHIGLLCVQESTTDRPTMSEVVYMLGKEAPLTSPKKPAFILQSSNPNSEEASIRGPSINNVTITMLEAR
ncbi:hypothetical protein ACLB2K_024271 [Fragaria x ananassa]